MKYILQLIFLFCFAQNIFAQPLPATKQTEATLITDATSHVGNGKVIEHGIIGFVDGKISLIADIVSSNFDKSIYKKTISAAGKHIYPGLIAPNTHLGLVEIEAARPHIPRCTIRRDSGRHHRAPQNASLRHRRNKNFSRV